MRRILLVIIPVLAVMAIGCDDKPSIPPAPDKAPDTPATPAAPTTQELLDGPRTKLTIPSMGLSVRVPKGWKLDTSVPKLVTLDGPAPSGDVEIELSTHDAAKANQPDWVLTKWKKDAAADPKHIQVPEIRTVNGMKVLERIEVPDATSRPSQSMITWVVTFYIPRGDLVQPRNFDFIGLTAEQYTADGTFLRSILDSIAQDNSSDIP